ncbi:hypothetical protein [Mesonia maritima]|uniref:Uncharacterized protein n=1 Tax=Mesonia maritima TaxID=1793873 RepID=A0ABU1K3L3_9FLAO|nr:hypothetical protein [Mesonia maritima]MDR6300183.1 hypothetical protein [Mesonia maritima]
MIKKAFILILFIIVSAELQAQCAMCRAVLESEADGGAAAAINDGIVYLMIWPYILIGGIAFLIYRVLRREFK